MTVETVATVKAVSAGSLSMVFMAAFNDVEFVMLLMAGAFASVMSYMYDWFHRVPPRKFGFVELTELGKAIFYGIPMMFIVYHYGVNNTTEFINIPLTAWGSIAMLAAGSAVAIVEWAAPILGGLVHFVRKDK